MARLPRFPRLGSALQRWAPSLVGYRLGGVRVLSLGLGLAMGLVVVAMLFAMHMSSTPTFCGSACHIMKPYYASWKQSKHNNIACVECHISPGITAELRKKFEALSMVAKYVTRTYGSNPWAEVEDAACLRCHERRLLEGKEVFHKVLFDHTPHLAETRRGMKLQCTSCHSQIVQGSHIAVTTSTCALCHFKGQPINQNTGRCLTCHEVPERVVSVEGVTFDHDEVRRLDMDCALCHGDVVRGDGAVARERCLTCHNQPERLSKFGDPDFLHRKHVSEHKVDCMHCHVEIEHGRPSTRTAARTAASAGSCESCHGSGHSPQQDLYAGIGGRGVPRMPGPMFAAGVTCQGCHNQTFTEAPAAAAAAIATPHSQRADEVSCMSCHGPAYGQIYRAWKRAMDERTAALRRQLEATVGAMGLQPPEPWQDARYNFDLVDRGKGVHNVSFAFALLDKAHEQMNAARRLKGLAPLSRPWVVVGAGSANCLGCHQGIESRSGAFAGRRFAHRPHLVGARLECQSCHRPHDQRAPGEVVRFGKDGCLPCHHRQREISGPQCMSCHGDVTARSMPSFRGEFSHQGHLETGLECGTCHPSGTGDPRPLKTACAQCHTD
jgi:predicted CXXCH cytochrome family protein